MRGGSRGKGWVLPPSAAHDLQFPPNIQHPSFFQITSGIELGSSDIHIGCDLDLGPCLLTILLCFSFLFFYRIR
ncbi:hypothetical protein HanRHA438_Chr05g0214271 [Helianthus annuus]|uniref:Uncharacterized protein n=1 Tax=Helianthus annuus TaxID=4232 RepID=A0A251UPY6_HELAN|nr:hypothetical protein HanXRQr2_Chr05g0204541 [Helianthus annuus]KAJ0569580.1 hypothetical protein HanHA300_Chr05g0167861 [Helianthus annuus]KAJ0576134.1 hypothetical protein HanIR_Chr05g0220761 [Helianthus annuus]KAJ0583891.1 hypothetical protein HanHA89_Chr05g0181911 [Helianthus annuus]KAJ0629006.1 hypothetical protein HanIR_Chr00c29g0911931 [Helianthus annuus]